MVFRWTRKAPILIAAIALLVAFSLLFIWNTHNIRVYAGSYMSPTHVGTPGYIDADTKGITGCNPPVVKFNDNNSGAPEGQYYFAAERLLINKPDGTSTSGNVILYSWSSQTYDNGYLMMDWSDLTSYVQVFGGDLSYVESQLSDNQTLVTPGNLHVVNLSTVASLSGAKWGPTETETSDGKINATYQVQTSAKPTGSIITDQSQYNVGDTVKITTDAEIDTFNTTWHREAIQLTGPNGYSKWIVGSGSASMDDMVAYAGGDTDDYGPPQFHSYKLTGSQEPALNVDTSGLEAGRYTLHYYLRDNLNRTAQTYPYTTSFNIGTVSSGGGGSTGGDDGQTPSITLSADPTLLYTGKPTTLTASASNVPQGDSITIVNETTGETVGTSGPNATSFSAQYTSYNDGDYYFVAYLGSDATSNEVVVTWKYPLSLTPLSAAVVHTPDWQKNLNLWNQKYPSQYRSSSLFWAGEELCFQVQHNPRYPGYWDIINATAQLSGLQYDAYGQTQNPPTSLTVPLTYDSTTGYLEGHTDPSLSTEFQYLADGTYTVNFTVESDGINGVPQTQYATATFTINGKWTDFWRDTQTY